MYKHSHLVLGKKNNNMTNFPQRRLRDHFSLITSKCMNKRSYQTTSEQLPFARQILLRAHSLGSYVEILKARYSVPLLNGGSELRIAYVHIIGSNNIITHKVAAVRISIQSNVSFVSCWRRQSLLLVFLHLKQWDAHGILNRLNPYWKL